MLRSTSNIQQTQLRLTKHSGRALVSQSVSRSPVSGDRGSESGVRTTYVSDKLIISTISFKNCVHVGVSHK